ncbi:MAG: hypothetical protein WDA16_09770 [Candidatus Thermoplasmatota archaeon]
MALKPGPLRDAVVLIVVFALLLGGLYLFTQTWPPAVIVESSSMMHDDSEVAYGRIGTIDPGDLVLVKHVSTPDDAMTLVENGPHHYGKAGDVLIYFPNDRRADTPIIHRAVAFVVVQGVGADVKYRVRWDPSAPCEGGAQKDPSDARWCVYGSAGVYIPSVPVQRLGSSPQNPEPYKPEHTGFLTKGDNPFTNRNIDQVSGLSQTVDVTWVEGKGRAELPWLGLIKLSLAGKANERNPLASWVKIGSAYAPKDLWVMLGVSLFVLVGLPLIYDGYKAIEARRGKSKHPPEAPREVTALSSQPGAVTVRWAPVAGAASYRVHRGPEVVGITGETSFTETGLDAALSYVYTVSALDADGVEGPRSHSASASPAPNAPVA